MLQLLGENHLYQNTVVRVQDDVGNPVSDYFLEFYEHDSDTSRLGRFFHRDVLRSVHKHSDDHNYRSLYIDVSLLLKRIDQPDVDALMINLHAEPRFEEEARVGYSEKETGVRLKVDQVVQLFRPNRTLLVDIIIKREMRDVFKIYELQ